MNFDPQGGVFAPPTDEQVAKRNSIKPPKSRKAVKTILVILLVIALLAGGAFAALKVLDSKEKPTQTAAVVTPEPQALVVDPGRDVPEFTETKQYENGPLGLKLTYPSTWKVTPAEDKGVRIESPAFSYTSLDKGDVTGVFRIYVRKGARTTDGAVIGRGVAIQPSEKLVYANPALDQRKDTLLSLFGLDTKDNFAFFLIAGNFQLNAGDTLGPDYGKEADAFIVGGGFSDDTLKDDMATHKVEISTLPTSRAYRQAVDILKSLQLR